MRDRVAAAIRGRPVAHWLTEFERASVPAGPVLLKDQVLDDEQVRANDYVVRLEHEQVGGMTVVAPPVKFSATPLDSAAPSPVLGRHTREVLAQAGARRGGHRGHGRARSGGGVTQRRGLRCTRAWARAFNRIIGGQVAPSTESRPHVERVTKGRPRPPRFTRGVVRIVGR